MAYYCSDCGEDITEFVEVFFGDSNQPIPKDVMCRKCKKKDEQLNKGKYDE